MSERTHDEFRELLGAFALDAVDEQESVEIRGHLSTCTTCAAEVDGHHEMTAMLANTGGDAPAHLWERIEAQLGTVPSRERTADSAGPPGRDDLVARRAARSARTTVLSVRLLAAAAVVALVAVLGNQVVRLENRVSGLQGANLQQQVARAAQRALADPAARHVVLDSANSTNRLAEIAVLPTGAAFLVNDALPALPRDRTYQLWGLVGTRLVSLGLLGANPTAVSFETGGGGLVSEYAITAEHAGGVVQSTHLPVAVSQA